MNKVLDIAISDNVKAIQKRHMPIQPPLKTTQSEDWPNALTQSAVNFIQQRRSFQLSTVNCDGQLYAQNRGGSLGRLRVLDSRTLAFVEPKGSRQCVARGNLNENPKACLFLIDFAARQRLKIWGEAHVSEGNDSAQSQVLQDREANPLQLIIFDIAVWRLRRRENFRAEDITKEISERDQRIVDLETTIAKFNGE